MSEIRISSEAIQRLKAVVGSAGCVETAADMAAYLRDERKLFHGRSPLVLKPASTDEVSKAVAICAGAGIGIVLASYLLSPRMDGPLEAFLSNLVLAAAYAGLVATVLGISPSRVRLMLAALRATES